MASSGSALTDTTDFLWIKNRQPGEEAERTIVSSDTQWTLAYSKLMDSLGAVRLLGFDLEGVSLVNYKRQMRRGRPVMWGLPSVLHENLKAERPCLMQLATLNGFVVIVQLGYFHTIPLTMRELLCDETVVKVGVNIQSDAHWMHERWGTRISGWLDLRNVCKDAEMVLPNEFELKRKLGLKHLAQTFFGEPKIPIEAMKLISYSNWARPDLTEEQLYYATFDAQVAVDIASVIVQKLLPKLKSPSPSIEQTEEIKELFSNHLHKGYSHAELPMQALKITDLESASDFQFRAYMYQICETLHDGEGSEIPGMAGSIEEVLKSEGRLPMYIREVMGKMNNRPPGGYLQSVNDKLIDDRDALLPAPADGRYPPTYWIHVPKLCHEIGTPMNRLQHRVLRLNDPLNWGQNEWALELETAIPVTCQQQTKRPNAMHKPQQQNTDNDGSLSQEDFSFDDSRINKGPYHGYAGACLSMPSRQLGQPKRISPQIYMEDYDNSAFGEDPNLAHTPWSTNKMSAMEDGYQLTSMSVSLLPCWMCGERRVERLNCEPVVPESYVQLYIRQAREARTCRCNWARLCARCCLEWRCAQFELMLELGAAFDASLDVPKYVADANAIKTRACAKRLITIEKAREKGRWMGRPGEKYELVQVLKDYCQASFDKPEDVLASIDSTWYTQNPEQNWHEIKVMEEFSWDVVLLESIFRGTLISSCKAISEGAFLPQSFSAIHHCHSNKNFKPPKSMTQEEVAKAVRKKDFYCDLHAAIEGVESMEGVGTVETKEFGETSQNFLALNSPFNCSDETTNKNNDGFLNENTSNSDNHHNASGNTRVHNFRNHPKVAKPFILDNRASREPHYRNWRSDMPNFYQGQPPWYHDHQQFLQAHPQGTNYRFIADRFQSRNRQQFVPFVPPRIQRMKAQSDYAPQMFDRQENPNNFENPMQ